jgi:pimeloyl-ACP methyl ester carboxylesterase
MGALTGRAGGEAMTVVFVHGALETGRLWDRLGPLLDTDSIALRLPGHAAPRPDGFSADKDAYSEWLAANISQVAGPVDLVGHGWGALLVLRAVTALKVPVRSWAVDGASAFHPDFAVGEVERTWQTPGAGERWMAEVQAAPAISPCGAAGRLALLGVPRPQAEAMGTALDDTMSRCVLDLARSAIPNARAGWPTPAGSAHGAGLVVVAGADPFDQDGLAQQVALDLRAQARRLDGLGHYWMAESPGRAATALGQFWSSLEP